MAVLIRGLKVLASLSLAFAGYFVMAAQGWPAPLDAMRLERGVIGGLILTLGFLCAVATCLPEPKPRKPRA